VSAFTFHDLMYPDSRPGINVRATLTLLDSVQNGRISRPGLRWRPNHNLGLPDGRAFYIGQVEFESDEAIQPGESREVIIRFIDGPGLRENLQPGAPGAFRRGRPWSRRPKQSRSWVKPNNRWSGP
jgi:hypothetical protein